VVLKVHSWSYMKQIVGLEWFAFCKVPLQLRFLFFIIHLFTRAYIVWVISPSCPHPPPSPPPRPTSWQNLFYPFLQFCWRVKIQLRFLKLQISWLGFHFVAMIHRRNFFTQKTILAWVVCKNQKSNYHFVQNNL
jgi:hypothetical protein